MRFYRVCLLLSFILQTIDLVDTRRVSRRAGKSAPANASVGSENSTATCLCTNPSISAANSTQRRGLPQTPANSTSNAANSTLDSNGINGCVCEEQQQSEVFPLIVSIVQVLHFLDTNATAKYHS
jgi:hypothetical protein